MILPGIFGLPPKKWTGRYFDASLPGPALIVIEDMYLGHVST